VVLYCPIGYPAVAQGALPVRLVISVEWRGPEEA
jgi:hypothetical protein